MEYFGGLEDYALDDVGLEMGGPIMRAMVVIATTSSATTCFRIFVSFCYLQNMKYSRTSSPIFASNEMLNKYNAH
jgi:hypothetical protein